MAGGGLWWLEVKAVAPFSLGSSTWTEMRAQAARLALTLTLTLSAGS